MLYVDTPNKTVGFTIKNTGAKEDLINILLDNGYWIKAEPKIDNKLIIYIKEDK